MENQQQNQRHGQPCRDQDMSPVERGILFQTFSEEIAKNNEDRPQEQNSQYEKAGEDPVGVRWPGIIPEYKQPKEACQSGESEYGNDTGNKKSREAKEQGIQVSLFHG